MTSVMIGKVVSVFDPQEWNGQDQGDNSQFFHPATILDVYYSSDLELLADVRFHHDGRVSTGHIVSLIQEVA